MGVLGLWRLLDPTGKPVAVETLEGNILAVDVSIWIHQVLQGYQDRRGESVSNAHLLGVFNRICKLLYFKIKPVFVFDGGVPMLKKKTIAFRRKQKSIAVDRAQKLKDDLINNLIKRCAVKNVFDKSNSKVEGSSLKETFKISGKSSVVDDMYKLPELPSTSQNQLDDLDLSTESDLDSSLELSPRKQLKWIGNIHQVKIDTEEFKNLPADVRYDILTDLKDTRKQNSWGRVHKMPQVLDDFSEFQMKRLLKRRYVQESLESAEKEIGGAKTLTLEELDKLLTEQGIKTSNHNDEAHRIASDSLTRVIFLNDNQLRKETTEASKSDTSSNLNDVPSLRRNSSYSDSGEEKFILENMHEYDLDENSDSDSGESSEMISDDEKNGSSLSDEIILSFIKQNKKHTSGSKSSKKLVGKKNEVLKKPVKSDGFENTLKEVKSFSLVISEEEIKEKHLSDDKAEEKDSDTDFMEVSNEPEIRPKVPEEQEMSESSDSDQDFVTVEDIPIPEAVYVSKSEAKSFDILLKPEQNLENDLFSDIFVTDPEDSKMVETVDRKLNEDSESKNLVKIESEILEVCNNKEKDESKSSDEKADENIKDDIEESPASSSGNIISTELIERSEEVPVKPQELLNEALSSISLPLTEEAFISMQNNLEEEQKELNEKISKLERQTLNVTDQIRAEVQELLQLFGIPYIVAPMEAEAQCAFLEQINLTDGTITDDSDIWLFGGKSVYKNFFNNNKKVLQFRSCDIENHFKLSRQQLIQLALLVGSDYTSGISGIGPVTAMEILASFPADENNLLQGLTNFSAWVKSGKIPGPGRTYLRNKLKNVRIEKGFPSQAVVQAYLSPTVDESEEKFAWGKPNLDLLFDFVRRKFGWTRLKFDETINPVMKKLLERRGQKGIDSYFKLETVRRIDENRISKRIQSAVKKMGSEGTEEESHVTSKRRKKGKAGTKKIKVVDQDTSSVQNLELDKIPEFEFTEDDLLQMQENLVTPPKTQSDSDNKIKENKEFIPQRESARAKAIKNKMHAIELLQKSKSKTSILKKKKKM